MASTDTADAESDEEEAPRRLDLEVEITDSGPCKKHVKVVIPPAEIETQFKDSLKSMRREAQVPGFRPGRAPVTLVQKRFRKEVAGQVKSSLVMAALEQIDKDHKLAPISRPDLDIEAIELKEGAPLQFEMEVEVQPDFPLPEYKGLNVQRPVREIQDADVDAQFTRFLERYAQEVPKLEGGAELGDQVTAHLRFEKDGVQLNDMPEAKFRLQRELRFQDGHMPDLDRVLAGARPGDVRDGEAHIGSSSPDPAIRGQTIRVIFEILDLKSYRLPEVDAEFLHSVGFDSVEDLRKGIREMLERRVKFSQRQALRRGILDQLVETTPFDLPPALVRRQEQSTLRRNVFELRQAGISDAEIRAREAEIRANAHESTLRSLKEFFILSRIAEAEDIKVEEEDLDLEIEAIAESSDESPRRVRSRIEKEGLGESLATQILERKALDRIIEQANVQDVVSTETEREVETLDQTAGPALPEGEPEDESAEEPPAGGELSEG